MAHQGFDLQLTHYDERGWRATFYTTGMEHSPVSHHQAFTDEFIFEIQSGRHRILKTVPWQETVQPPACKFT